MKMINAFDSNVQIPKDKTYELYLEGNSQFMQFALYDKEQNHFLGVKQWIAELGEKVEDLLSSMLEDNLLNEIKFQNIIFSYSSHRAMLVPQTLFDAEHLEDFLKFHHKIEDSEKILYHYIPKADAFLIYTCPINIENYLKPKFHNVEIKHHAIPFICMALNKNIQSHLPAVHIFLGHNFFDLLVLKQEKILLFNSFYYQKHTDVLYFLVNVSNLFSIPPHNSQMYVSGNIDQNSYATIVSELKNIFPYIISEDTISENFSYAKGILELPQHQLKTLIALKLCV
ncbi:MAG: DUF3822 family protein [Bacteroidales bacterium]|nr:DUF3822 family protein [Bacteroidales bacterium]